VKENVKHVYDELSGKIDQRPARHAFAPLDLLRTETAAHTALPTVLRPRDGIGRRPWGARPPPRGLSSTSS